MCEAQKNDAHDICKFLCRTLAEDGRVEVVSEKFAALKTNQDRLSFAHDLIQNYDLLPPKPTTDGKNNELSTKFRGEGNEKFKNKNNEEALELYTKSIAFGEKNTKNLGIAFANRSAVLFEHGFYEECLQDIERAFANNYPENLQEKLNHRRKKAEQLKTQQKRQNYHETIPNLSSKPNETIECASDQVKIHHTEKMGRHVTATKNISVGEVIAIEKPYAKILLKTHTYTHCHNCLKLCQNLLPCEKCTFALFCDEFCLNDAQSSYHKYECAILTDLVNLGCNKLALVALRVAICAQNQEEDLGKPQKNATYRAQNYGEVHELVANTEKRTNADLFARAVQTATIFDLVRKRTEFFTDGVGVDENFFKELLLLHYQTGPSNFHEISELAHTADGYYENFEIGAGVYPFLSLLNHACSPNVVRHCYGTTIVLRALRPIRPGEQLFDNYGYHSAVMVKNERQKHLNEQYYFECTCEACTNDWPLYKNLPVVDFDLEVDQEDLDQLRRANLGIAHKILGGITQKVTFLEDFAPCRNLADAQEIMKQCFAIFGNKHKRLS